MQSSLVDDIEGFDIDLETSTRNVTRPSPVVSLQIRLG